MTKWHEKGGYKVMLQVCSVRYWYLAVVLKRLPAWAGLNLQHDMYTTVHFLSFLMFLSWRVVQTCSAVCFLQVYVIVLQMEWTQERVIVFMEGYNREEIIWNPQHFNKIKKQDAREKLAKEINSPIDECKKKLKTYSRLSDGGKWGWSTRTGKHEYL